MAATCRSRGWEAICSDGDARRGEAGVTVAVLPCVLSKGRIRRLSRHGQPQTAASYYPPATGVARSRRS